MDDQQWQAFLDATRTEVVAGCIIGIVDENNRRAYLTVEGVKTPEGEKLYQAWEDAGSPPVFTVPPNITSSFPASGPSGTSVTLYGTDFGMYGTRKRVGVRIDSSKIFIGDVEQPLWSVWFPGMIIFTSTPGALPLNTSHDIKIVRADGVESNVFTGFSFSDPVAPAIAQVSPPTGPDGATVTISGQHFEGNGPNSRVIVGTQEHVTPSGSWGVSNISFPVVQGANSVGMPVDVTVTNQSGLSGTAIAAFTFPAPLPPPAPVVTSCTPASGMEGTEITIVGTGFQVQDATSQVLIGAVAAMVVSWSDTTVTALAVLGANALDTSTAVTLQAADLQQVAAGTFTFTAV